MVHLLTDKRHMKAILFNSSILNIFQEVVDFIEKVKKQQIAFAIILWHLS